MADDELVKVELNDSFYRDSISHVVWVIIGLVIALILVAGMSIYLYTQKPPPLVFSVADDFRVQPPVPIDQPYLKDPDLLQWVANVFINTFAFDYINYTEEVNAAQPFYTTNGWTDFQNQLNIYANYNNVQQNRLFVNGSPSAAPYIVNQGLLTGKYAWIINLPLLVKYQGLKPPPNKNLSLRITVVRVSTLNNLNGVAIDKLEVITPDATTGNGTGS